MIKHNDKFNLTFEQNVFLAKKLIKHTIFFGAKMEGSNITFPQTETILNGVNVADVGLDDIQTVLNLRDAWRYMFSTLNEPMSLEYICKINEYTARNEALEWGRLRTGNVSISGTDYVPPLPDKTLAENKINDILSDTGLSATEKAAYLFLWCARSQLFWDGNKRTALLAANKYLIMNGKGLLYVAENRMLEFSSMLSEFYTTGNFEKAIDFICSECIAGLEFENQTVKEAADEEPEL